jgi:hypothetical protein
VWIRVLHILRARKMWKAVLGDGFDIICRILTERLVRRVQN